jgi:predicted RecB family nuclease
VPPQGGYLAKRCPVRAQNDSDLTLRGQALAPTEAEHLRIEAGKDFESRVIAALLETLGHEAIVIEVSDREAAQRETLAAMQAGARAIAGGWLPDDIEGRRTGRPDLLIRARDAQDPRYVPVDVKHHRLAYGGISSGLLASTLDAPEPDGAVEVADRFFHYQHLLDDALQLAHYWRILDHHGFTPTEEALGGIIDRDVDEALRIWWIDLRTPRWKLWWSDRRVSVLERYDHEFAFRLDVIAHTIAASKDPSLGRKVEPVRIGECSTCPWRGICLSELEQIDHVSLLPGSTWAKFVEHRRRGVVSRYQLARLDWRTAAAIYGRRRDNHRIDVPAIIASATGHRPETTIAEIVGARKKSVVRRLAELGISTVGDLEDLDHKTLSYSNANVGWLPGSIDEARAASSGRPWRARGITQVHVPRGDIEVDLDMENTGDGLVYLWGILTTRRRSDAPSVPQGYDPVMSWEPLTPRTEAELFARCWSKLMSIRAATRSAGLTFRLFCYTNAEQTQMRRIALQAGDVPACPTVPEVDAFMASVDCVDLHHAFTTQIVTGASAGLKATAALTGFAWRDQDPNGEQSMVWYRDATTGPQDQRIASQRRILAYNEDDVLATAALREWLARDASPLPSIEAWVAT